MEDTVKTEEAMGGGVTFRWILAGRECKVDGSGSGSFSVACVVSSCIDLFRVLGMVSVQTSVDCRPLPRLLYENQSKNTWRFVLRQQWILPGFPFVFATPRCVSSPQLGFVFFPFDSISLLARGDQEESRYHGRCLYVVDQCYLVRRRRDLGWRWIRELQACADSYLSRKLTNDGYSNV